MNFPTVSICVTAYQPTAKSYLDLCVKSIRNLDYPADKLEVIVVSPESYHPRYDGVKTICPETEDYSMPAGLNAGLRAASSDYRFVLNDDVILTKASLSRLVRWAEYLPNLGLLMPMGNDQQGRYYTSISPIGPYTIETLKSSPHDVNKLQDYIWGGPRWECLTFHDTLCLYAFLISRKALETIGPFDENLIGQDDIDYSIRSRRAGFINAIALDSLVWHAGGASNKLTDEQRAESLRIFNAKWSS